MSTALFATCHYYSWWMHQHCLTHALCLGRRLPWWTSIDYSKVYMPFEPWNNCCIFPTVPVPSNTYNKPLLVPRCAPEASRPAAAAAVAALVTAVDFKRDALVHDC
mmetsp:Transcript_34953/g.77728  ORF Transcript_34953/g.77728 Transcript_34953/m.77728 type:complete len:106 (+) Transcript_34953:359-676(+)